MKNNNYLTEDVIPLEFYLSQNYPNPFKEKTTIKYCVAYKTRVQLTVYLFEGKVVEKLVDEEKEAGTYEVVFHLPIDDELSVNKKYFYRLEAGQYKSEKRMFLLR